MPRQRKPPKPEPKPVLDPHWKIRIVVGGSLLHFASHTEPQLLNGYPPPGIDADWIEEPLYGDTLAYIDWPAVNAITWRHHP